MREPFHDTTATNGRAVLPLSNDHQDFDRVDQRNIRAQRHPSKADAYSNTVNGNLQSEYSAAAFKTPNADCPPVYQSPTSAASERGGEVTSELNVNHNMYSGALPFDNLNVEELWNWMLIMESNDTQGDPMYDNIGCL
jgi:hypothetical protein